MADNPGIFLLGFFWMGFVATALMSVGKLTRAPLFFIAVGSQANIGGVASAPVVAAAFDPALAPVGALLAVLGNIAGLHAFMCICACAHTDLCAIHHALHPDRNDKGNMRTTDGEHRGVVPM